MTSVFYRIADLILKVETDKEPSISRQDMSSFETKNTSPDIIFRFHPQDPSILDLTPTMQKEIDTISHRYFCFNGHWDSPFLRSGAVRRLLTTDRMNPADVSLESLESTLRILDFANNTQDIFHIPAFQSETFFRYRGEFYLAPLLARFDAIILHSASVVRKERAAVFLGHDGAGKTTVATSPPSGPILCDDQVIIRKKQEGFFVHGTPWGRIFDASLSAPLGALFLLEQAEAFSLTPFNPKMLLEHIWAEYPYYHLPLPIKLRNIAFTMVCTLCHSTPVYLMRFGKDNVDWDAIDAVMMGL